MKTMYDIFSKSPFGLLADHMNKVAECVLFVQPLVDAFIANDEAKMKEMLDNITKTEHEADVIKDHIREHLPKSIFMPVSREDLLKLLHRQDNIADFCEDLAFLLSVRKTPVIDELKDDFLDFVAQVIVTATQAVELTRKIHELMESSFSGPSAKEVLKMIEVICEGEWKSDKKKYKLVKKMFVHEDKIDPVSHVLFLKIFDVVSGIADSAESSANALRLMISK